MEALYADIGRFICLTMGFALCAGLVIAAAWFLCGLGNVFFEEQARRLTRKVMALRIIRDWEKKGRPLVEGAGYDELIARMENLVEASSACIADMGAIGTSVSPDLKARLRMALEPFVSAYPHIESELLEYPINQAKFDIDD